MSVIPNKGKLRPYVVFNSAIAWGGHTKTKRKEMICMELVPWRPFGELSSVRREMDKLWNQLLGETHFARTFTEEWFPSADISETEDKLLIEVKLPGLEAKDVSVSISRDILTIKGEKKKEFEVKVK